MKQLFINTLFTVALFAISISQVFSQQVQITEHGIILPIVDHTQIVTPDPGLMVYDGETASFWFYSGDTWGEVNDMAEASATDELQEFQVSETNDTLFLTNGNFMIVPGISAANESPGGGGQNGTPGPDITDVEGNVYGTVIIGTQTWMSSNLKTTKYNDGVSIPLTETNAAWANSHYNDIPAFCWYNNDSTTYAASNGALYNAYSIFEANNGNKNICPSGYHVPTIEDYNTFDTYLEDNNFIGGDLKSEGTTYWTSESAGATDSLGFSAHGAGVRISSSGNFNDLYNVATFHTSTGYNDGVNFAFSLYHNNDNLLIGNGTSQRGVGRSVRCLKD